MIPPPPYTWKAFLREKLSDLSWKDLKRVVRRIRYSEFGEEYHSRFNAAAADRRLRLQQWAAGVEMMTRGMLAGQLAAMRAGVHGSPAGDEPLLHACSMVLEGEGTLKCPHCCLRLGRRSPNSLWAQLITSHSAGVRFFSRHSPRSQQDHSPFIIFIII